MFNPLLNGEHASRAMDLPALPDVVDSANFLMVDPPDDVGEDTEHDEVKSKATDGGDGEAEGNGDFGDYHLVADPWAANDVKTFPLARACLRVGTGDQGLAYFFADTHFVRLNIASNVRVTDTLGKGGVRLIVDAFPALHEVQFPTIDAALPNPSKSDEICFFCRGEKYIPA